MPNTIATGIINLDLASQGSTAPEWVMLLPRGPNVNARDGREWTYDPKNPIADFEKKRNPMPIDYEHGQDLLANRGHIAVAAGWIVKMEARDGALWGQVEWTAKASAMILAREYRFLSPALMFNRAGEITHLVGAGLVNRPALEMTALSREDLTLTSQQENAMSFKAIAKVLGLADGADETAVLAELAKRDTESKALANTLGLEPGFAAGDINTKAIAITKELGVAVASLETKGDPGELAILKVQLGEATALLAALQKKDLNRDIDAALDAQIAVGKIAPASRDQYRAMCAEAGGLDKFIALAATLPVICEPSNLGDKKPTTKTVDDIDPDALAGLARVKVDEQAKLGRVITISQAIAEIQEDQK